MYGKNLPLIVHLSELRRRIIICCVCVVLATCVAMPFSSAVLKILLLPAHDNLGKLAVFSPTEAFSVYMRIGVLCGIIVSLPVILYQAWLFIAPALSAPVKRRAFWFISVAVCGFLAGCLFAYFVLIPPALTFLLTIGTADFMPLISASKYISFIAALLLACGIMFQMPIVIFILAKIGIVNSRMLRKHFSGAVVGMLIASAIITPTTDAINMLALAVPMIALYIVSIALAWFGERRNTYKKGE